MGRARTSIIVAAAVLVTAAAVLAALYFVPSLSTWSGSRIRCSLQLDHPAPLPAGTPLQLTFVTSGTRGAYDYEVSVDNSPSERGTTTESRFSVPAEFTVAGTSMITVTLTADGKPHTFLFSLLIS
ncbi:MAG: hypothetical protein ACYDHF_07935 [Candidatus Cryosericum sp.]